MTCSRVLQEHPHALGLSVNCYFRTHRVFLLYGMFYIKGVLVMTMQDTFFTFVRTFKSCEFIDVFLLTKDEQEEWFLTLPTEASAQFFVQGVLHSDTIFPDGKSCLLRAFHSDTEGEVGHGRLVKQSGHLELWERTGIFTTSLEAHKYATCPSCGEEAILLANLAETEPAVDEQGQLHYYCPTCTSVVTA